MTRLLQRLIADDAGTMTIEVALYVPAVAMLAGLLWMFGVTAVAGSTVLHAATDAARAASVQRTAADAQHDAVAVAHAVLDHDHLHCHDITVAVDTSGFRVPVGQPAQVAVDVTCRISLGDLYVRGLHGEKVLHEHGVSSLDTFRART
jgi:Flp pilus assembly protein TadG